MRPENTAGIFILMLLTLIISLALSCFPLLTCTAGGEIQEDKVHEDTPMQQSRESWQSQKSCSCVGSRPLPGDLASALQNLEAQHTSAMQANAWAVQANARVSLVMHLVQSFCVAGREEGGGGRNNF